MSAEMRTFRGSSLEEALAQARDELGSDAIVVREREGVIGGVGGFFGKHCVELDVVAQQRRSIDVYDTIVEQAAPFATLLEEAADDEDDELWLANTTWDPFEEPPAVSFDPDPLPERDMPSNVVAGHVLEAPATLELAAVEPEAPEPVPDIALLAEPDAGLLPEPIPAEPDTSSNHVAGHVSVRPEIADPFLHLLQAGIEQKLARDIVAEAESEYRLFAPHEPLHDQLVAALARRIRVARPARRKQRVVTVIGGSGSGKTLTAARICHAYATSGATVAALSLGTVREAMALAQSTQTFDVDVAVANGRRELRAELAKLETDLLVVDTPPVRTTTEMRKLASLLEVVGSDETHLLLPATLNAEAVDELLDAVQPTLAPDRLLLTQLDRPGSIGAAVSAAIKRRLPISFTSVGGAWGLRPADAHAIAELVLA